MFQVPEDDTARQEAVRAFVKMTGGNPGTIVLGRELEEAGYFEIVDLVVVAEKFGLVNNALYILHKEFGGKDLAATAEILEQLQKTPDLERPKIRSGEMLHVLREVLKSMQDDRVHFSA